MKRNLISYLALLMACTSVLVIYGCGSSSEINRTSETADYSINKKFAPAELKEDFDFLNKTFEDVHPCIYARTSKEYIQLEAEKIKKSLSEPRTRIEFYKILAPYAAKFNEGHTGIDQPYAEVEFANKKGRRGFPVEICFEDSEAVVIKNYTSDSGIFPGLRIKSINNILVNKIKDSIIQYMGFERYTMRLAGAELSFPRWLYLVYGFDKDFEIEYRMPGLQQYQKKIIPGILSDSLSALRIQYLDVFNNIHYEYKSYPREAIGLIDFRQFTDLDKFEDFLEDAFLQFKKDSIKDLIIDIRNNGGGNSELGNELINYITDKPYRMFSRIEIKKSEQIEEYLSSKVPWLFRWAIPLGLIDFFPDPVSSDGMALWTQDYIEPANKSLKFKGNVYVLAGPKTFSSAADFASAIKDFNLGVIIGEETGGLPTTTGDLYPFTLPNTKIEAHVSHKKFVRPGGEDDGKGVIPDYEVFQSLEAKINRTDTVLEFAKDLILKKRIVNSHR